jgi:hypothetical protein
MEPSTKKMSLKHLTCRMWSLFSLSVYKFHNTDLNTNMWQRKKIISCFHFNLSPLDKSKVKLQSPLNLIENLSSNVVFLSLGHSAVLCYVYDVLVRICYNRKSDWKLSCVMYTMYLSEFDTTENLIGSCPVLCIRCTC